MQFKNFVDNNESQILKIKKLTGKLLIFFFIGKFLLTLWIFGDTCIATYICIYVYMYMFLLMINKVVSINFPWTFFPYIQYPPVICSLHLLKVLLATAYFEDISALLT